MEYATALLLAESAFENYASLAARFPEAGRRDAVAPRRRAHGAAVAGAAAAPMLDEMSKRAQERVLLAQVGREIQANLRHMEQVLDAFFRDNAKRAELATLGKDSQQIRGTDTIESLVEQEYKYGFVTDVESESAPPGLSEDTIRLISVKKKEPEWLMDWRLKAYRHWLTMPEPTWQFVKYPTIDFQAITYFSQPKPKR